MSVSVSASELLKVEMRENDGIGIRFLSLVLCICVVQLRFAESEFAGQPNRQPAKPDLGPEHQWAEAGRAVRNDRGALEGMRFSAPSRNARRGTNDALNRESLMAFRPIFAKAGDMRIGQCTAVRPRMSDPL